MKKRGFRFKFKKNKFKLSPGVKKLLSVALGIFAVATIIGFGASVLMKPTRGGGVLPPVGSLEGDAILPDDYTPSEGLLYESNGDGTCTVTGIENFEGQSLKIPSFSPDGEKVTRI